LHDAYSVELDKQGRVLIQQVLRDTIGLSGKCAMVGCGDYIEVWEPGRWEAELSAVAVDEQEDQR
jgi:MraZ protein